MHTQIFIDVIKIYKLLFLFSGVRGKSSKRRRSRSPGGQRESSDQRRKVCHPSSPLQYFSP